MFSRGTVSPEQQKKVPMTQTQDEEHRVDGNLFIFMCSVLCLNNMKNENAFFSREHSFKVQI